MGNEARGDVAIRRLWKRGETCTLDICVTDTGAKAYKGLFFEDCARGGGPGQEG